MPKKKNKKIVEVKKLPYIEKEYFEDIEVKDPLTGKTIKQNIKITRYVPRYSVPTEDENEEESIDVIDKINESVSFTPIIDIDM